MATNQDIIDEGLARGIPMDTLEAAVTPVTDEEIQDKALKEAPAVQPEITPEILKRPVPAEAPQVQPLSGASFFSEGSQGSRTFFEEFSISTSKPKDPVKSSEAGFLVATGLAMYGEEVPDVVQEVATELSTTGSSVLFNDFIQKREKDEVYSINSSLWENIEALTNVQRDPTTGLAIQSQVEQEIMDVKSIDKTAQLIADVTQGLSPEQLQTFQNFKFITGEVLYRRAVDDMLRVREQDELSKAGVLDWAAALLNPAQPVTSRYDQGKLLGILQESFGESTSVQQYVFKSAHAGKIESYLTEEDLSLDELHSRLDELESVLQDIDTVSMDINPVYSAELFSVIRSELNGRTVLTEGRVADALDATMIAAVARPLRNLAKFASVKIFGKTAMSASWSPESIREVNRLIDQAVQESAVAGRVSRESPTLTVQSSQGATLDAIAAANPARAADMLQSGLQQGSDFSVLGVTPENIAERMIPAGENPVGVHPALISGEVTNSERINQSELLAKFSRELTDHSPTNLLREGELTEVPDKYTEMVVKNSRGTLHPSVSPVLNEADGNLSVLATFGKSSSGGYESIQEADDAAKFLFSDNYEILAKPKGIQSELVPVADIPDDVEQVEFFVRHKAEIRADASLVNPFGSEVLFPSLPWMDSVQSVSKRISKDLFDTVSNFTDKSTRLSGIAREMLNPISRLRSGRETASWVRMLEHGDKEEIIFSSREHAESVLGTRISNNAWEAYTGTRDFYDAMGMVRQRAAYRRLSQNGFKSSYTKDGLLRDPDGLVHTRPLVERPVLSSEKITDGGQGVWGREIYDVSTGEYVQLTDELLDGIYAGSDKIVVQLSRNAEFSSGKFSSFAIIDSGSVRELVQNPMNIRPGHLDVNYKGEDLLSSIGIGYKGGNRYKVDVAVTQVVNGVDDTYRRAVGIYANQQQADNAKAAMIADEIDQLGDGATVEAIAAIESKYSVDITREASMELGIDQAGTLTNLPAHARKRGERLLGYDGVAETLNVEEALTRGVNEARNLLGVEAIEMMKSRFQKTYAQFIDNYDGFRDTFDKYNWKPEAVSSGMVSEAKAWHQMVQNMDRAMSGKEVSLFLHHLDSWAFQLANAGKTGQASAVRGVSKAADKAYTLNKELTTSLFITSRTLYQMLANSSQMLWLAAQNPLDFMTGGVKGTTAVLMNLGTKGKIPSSVLGRALHHKMTGDQFDLYMENMRESGLFSTDLADDVLSVIGASGKIEAGKHSLLSKSFYKGLINPAEVNRRLGKALMLPQRATVDMANLVSYNHAAAQMMRQKGIDYTLSRRGQQELLANTRRLTFNQNRADQFGYQQNLLSVQLQFLQHVHRMYMDLLVDPALRVVSGNKLGVSKDGTNVYADTYAQSLMTLAGVAGMFGAGNLLPEGVEDEFTKSMNSAGVPPELVSTFMDGLVGLGFEKAFGERFDVASRLTPIGALESTISMMQTNDGGWIIGGASQVLPDASGKLGKIAQSYYTNENMTFDDALFFMKDVGTKYLAGLRDVDKAVIAARWQQYVDSNRRPISEVTDTAWIPVMFSIPPESVQDRYRQLDKVYDVRDEAKLLSNIANRVAVGKLSEKDLETVTGDDVINATIEGMRMIDTLSQSNPNLGKLAKDSFVEQLALRSDGMLAMHAQKLFQTLSTKDAIAELEKFKSLNPQHTGTVDTFIEVLQVKEQQDGVQ